MNYRLSQRLRDVMESLPLFPNIRVLEIGCGTGTLARAISQNIVDGHILAVDRSSKAISKATESSQKEIASGRLSFRRVAIEDFELMEEELPFDIAFGIRVGALDGRHPELGKLAMPKIKKALIKNGKVYVDSKDSIVQIKI